MLKTACFFTGDNYTLVAVDTPASKKKIVAMALAMMVPVLIWVFNGFMLSFQVLNTGLGWALLTAIVSGTIVFMIEKLIIMANGNVWLTFFRVLIGLIVGLLGSIAIDEVVFKNDIDISVASLKETNIIAAKKSAAAEFMDLNNYTNIDKGIEDAKGNFDTAEANAVAEADGTNGTKTRGLGGIAKLKLQKANERKADLGNMVDKKRILNVAKDSLVNIAELRAKKSFNEHALLIRIKALFQLVSEDGYMLTIYALFTLLMFFFEFLVVILKLTWKKTNYERRLEMIESTGQKRMEFIQSNRILLNDPGYYLTQFSRERESLNRNTSLYN